MGDQENKDLVRRFDAEVFNGHNLEAADGFIADDAVEHDPLPGFGNDKQGAIGTIGQILDAFPDMQSEITQLIASGDKVAINSTFRGTHDGDFMGVPATGKSIEVNGIDIVRVENGKFVEHWGIFDAMSLMQQIGAIPPPAGS
jgi:steroid delta-isomerase-like uncharacterized protein